MANSGQLLKILKAMMSIQYPQSNFASNLVSCCCCFFLSFFYVPSLGILEKITLSIASPVMCPAVSLHFLFPSCMSTTPLTSQNQRTSLYRQARYWTERSLINRSCLTSQQTLWPRMKYMTSDLRCWKNFIPRWVMGHSNLRSWIVRVGIVCVKMNTKEKQLINKASDIRNLLSFAVLWLTYWNLALIRAFLSRNNERNSASYKR